MKVLEQAEQIIPIERAVLGGMLAQGAKSIPPLMAEDFFLGKHQSVFKAICDLAEQDSDATVFTVMQHLAATKQPVADMMTYLTQIEEEAGGFGSVLNLLGYAKQIRAAANRRRMAKFGTECPYMTAEQAAQALDSMPGPIETIGYDPAVDWAEIGTLQRVMTGYPSLDAICRGIWYGELMVLAGRTSHGKTAFAKSVALKIAQSGTPVDYITLEEPRRNITARLVAEMVKVPIEAIRENHLSQQQADLCAHALADLQGIPMNVVAPMGASAFTEQGLIAAVATSTAPVIFIDHMQQVVSRGNRNDALQTVVNRLHQAARRLDKAVVVLAQLNRDMEKGDEARPPRLSDLRDTGALEMTARQVWFVYWEVKQKDVMGLLAPEDKTEDALANYKLFVAKNSNGRTGPVHFQFDRFTGTFTDPNAVAATQPETDLDAWHTPPNPDDF